MSTRPILRYANACLAVVVLLCAAAASPASAATNMLVNPGFEGATGGSLAGWGSFSNAFADGTTPHTGAGVAKLFGSFNGGFGVSGVFQDFPAAPGDQFTLNVWSRHNTGDALTGGGPATNDNWAVQKIAFFNGPTEIGGVESIILTGASPTDIWIDNPPVIGTAPAGTTHVQPLILFLQPGPPNDGGAGLFDDAVFAVVPEPSALALLGVAGLALLRRRERRAA